MKIQVLASTMNQENHDLLKNMNIQSDAIVINQGSKHDYELINFRSYQVKWYSFVEKGVGLSRNNALMRADREISVFADEDLTYVDGYTKIIEKEFLRLPKADMIIFNVESENELRPSHYIKKSKRVRIYNALKYGAVRIAFKTKEIKKKNINFSLLYGGGAPFGSGEDSLFIVESLKKGLVLYTSTENIGSVSQEDSTWFDGYNDKYFIDKGHLFANLFGRMKYLIIVFYSFKWKNISDKSMVEVYKLLLSGVRKFDSKEL